LCKQSKQTEHFTIYNKRNLSEKYWISLRLSLGNLTNFFSAPGPKVNKNKTRTNNEHRTKTTQTQNKRNQKKKTQNQNRSKTKTKPT
jgi:hypothetical protein